MVNGTSSPWPDIRLRPTPRRPVSIRGLVGDLALADGLASRRVFLYSSRVKMKSFMWAVAAGGVLWFGGALRMPAQVPKDVQAREMELLRKTLAEQQKHPDQIIRTPQTLAFSTNP